MTETLETVRTCLDLGADPNGVDEYGRTPLEWAGDSGDPAIRAALLEAGADSAVAAERQEARADSMLAAERAEAARRAEEQRLAALAERRRPGRVFRDCAVCPEMVVAPAGSYMMGSPPSEEGRSSNEGPRHRVTIGYSLAVGVYEVTFAEWDACVVAGGCAGHWPNDRGWGRGGRPVMNVNWEDAREYVRWLSRETEQKYRLLSESEWEYAARAGTTTARYWGESESGRCRYGNGYDRTGGCSDGYEYTAPVGSYQPNAFGLYDMLGNVHEWTADCWNDDYSEAPADGSAWQTGDCSVRVLRGRSWLYDPGVLRSASRGKNSGRFDSVGFRVARTIN